MRGKGLTVIRHKERFAEDASDVEWLTAAGAEGWIAFTRDKNIRYRVIELMALISAGVRAFVFTGGNVSGVELSETIVAALPLIERVVATTKPPFICRITASGGVDVIYPT